MTQPTFLSQWTTSESGAAAQGPAKQHEFTIYVPPLLETLKRLNVRTVIDFQADEGVVSVAHCMQSPENYAVFVPPPAESDPKGIFRKMAMDITAPLRTRYNKHIFIIDSLEKVVPISADAILMNNILGLQNDVADIENIVKVSAKKVCRNGYAIVTIPNPHGGVFSSYSCQIEPDAEYGDEYDFQMASEPDVFKNLHTPIEGLRSVFEHHGYQMKETSFIPDRPYEGRCGTHNAFTQLVFQRQPVPAM